MNRSELGPNVLMLNGLNCLVLTHLLNGLGLYRLGHKRVDSTHPFDSSYSYVSIVKSGMEF